MATEINQRVHQPPANPPPEGTPAQPKTPDTQQIVEQSAGQAEQTQQQAEQAQVDHAQDAQKAQAAAEAQRLAQQQLLKITEKPQSLTFEFLSAFQTIFQEGYENYRVPHSSQGAGVFSDQRGREFQKDLGIIREFLREANRLVSDQKTDIRQMFHWIRTEQGGQFWQRVQQALGREWSGPRPEEGGGGKLGPGREGEKESLDAMKHRPGRAMLELLQTESNPRAQLENYLLVLQMLRQEGLKDSSQKMVSYLRRRFNLSEEEMHRFLSHYGLVYFQGPMPREEKTPVNLWYFLVALLAVPTAILLGVDFLWSALIGVTLAVFVLAFFRLSGK